MPPRYYDDLVPLRHFHSSSDFLSPVVYRPSRSSHRGHHSRDDRHYPYDFRRRHHKDDDGFGKVRKTLEELTEPNLVRHGDLGWTLEYATAYCYRFLTGNRPCIVDTIDTARQAPLGKKAPFLVFDSLDRSLFQGKLNGMVYLKWRVLSDKSTGVTNAPGVRDPRICIELNSRPYEESGAILDDLLEALIHQMIHAYFLVCCGALKKDSEEDGRLLDGLHFGVLLYTILEISGACEEGPLHLTFYAQHRSRRRRGPRDANSNDTYRQLISGRQTRSVPRPYLAVDPRGDTIGPPPNDGQSHCMHDNRRFRGADIRNWQVSNYASAIELEMDKKGEIVYDLDVSGELVPVDRLRGPPSSDYVELVWDEKRVMAPREKVLAFESLKKPGKREGKYELHMPKCDFHTLKCLWDFIQHKKYSPQYSSLDATVTSRHHHREDLKGPPIIVHGGNAYGPDSVDGMTVHIRVFKAAESMKFGELQKYAMGRLYEMPTTADDPITALKEIYLEPVDKNKPIHAELHKWARKFLARTDEHRYHQHQPSDMDPWTATPYPYHQQRGTSNYKKILSIHGSRFQDLYHQSPALKDDSKLVVAELSYPSHLNDDPATGIPMPIDSQVPPNHLPSHATAAVTRPYSPPPLARRRRRSFSDYYDPIDWRYDNPYSPDPLLHPPYVYPSAAAIAGVPVTAPLALDMPISPYYDYFSRGSGRRRRVNALTGDRYTRFRGRWRDLYGLV